MTNSLPLLLLVATNFVTVEYVIDLHGRRWAVQEEVVSTNTVVRQVVTNVVVTVVTNDIPVGLPGPGYTNGVTRRVPVWEPPLPGRVKE